MSHNKGDTLVRSPPSVMNVELYGSAHVGGHKSTWVEPTGGFVAKISPSPSSNSIHKNNDDGLWKNNRNKDKKNRQQITEEVEKGCSCDAAVRVGQLEHDLSEIKSTHELILNGLHQQLDQLKQKNRDLTFQLLMGPYAEKIRIDPNSPESDGLLSPKSLTNDSKLPSPKENVSKPETEKKEHQKTEKSLVEEMKINSSQKLAKSPLKKISSQNQKENQPEDNLKNIVNGSEQSNDVFKRSYRGRSAIEDPRMVRSLDFELLEEEAEETRRLLHEERAKNHYLATLVEDLKRQLKTGQGKEVKGSTTEQHPKAPLARNLNDSLSSLHRTLGSTNTQSNPLLFNRPANPSPSRALTSDSATPRLPLLPLQQQQPKSPSKIYRDKNTQKNRNTNSLDTSFDRNPNTTILPAINPQPHKKTEPENFQNQQTSSQYRRGKYNRGRARQRQSLPEDKNSQSPQVPRKNDTEQHSPAPVDKSSLYHSPSLRGRPKFGRSSSRGGGTSNEVADARQSLSNERKPNIPTARSMEHSLDNQASTSAKDSVKQVHQNGVKQDSNTQNGVKQDSNSQRPNGKAKNRGRNRRGARGKRKDQQNDQQQNN